MSEKAKAGKAAPTPKWSLLESAMWSPAKAGDNVTGSLGAPESGPFGEQHTLTDCAVATPFDAPTVTAALVVLPHLAALYDLSRVPLGAVVRITFTGEKVSKAGNTYKAFNIEVAA